jgi:hypothetical protein
MKFRNLSLIFFGLAITGCAGVDYVLENYRGVEPIRFEMTDDAYRIFEHPNRNTIMITPSLGTSAGVGAVRGFTFGAIDGLAPKPRFERAVRDYLDKTSRKHCEITDGYIVLDPQYEFKFRCRDSKHDKEPHSKFEAPNPNEWRPPDG